jgi:hypothetical protein
MKTRTITFISGLLLVLAACGRDGVRHGAQQQYETVQEGQAAGVTSTIQGPGETLPPMTATNADTTSAFTINPALATGPATPPGTLAGALPSRPYGGAGGPGYQPSPMTSASRPAQSAQPVREQQPTYVTPPQPQQPVTTSSTETVAPTETQTQTDTATAPPPQTQTDTAPREKAEKPQKSEEKPPAEKTDTQQQAPPPPPSAPEAGAATFAA